MKRKIFEFKYALFDNDGTLINNMDASAEAFGRICKKAGIPVVIGKKLHFQTAGTPLVEQVKQIFQKFEKSNDSVENLSDSFFKIRSSLPEWQNATAFPRVKDVLKKLSYEGVEIFSTSGSGTEETIESLKRNKLYGYFSLVLGGDKIPKSTEHIKKFAECAGKSLEDFCKSAIIIGDGTNDMKIAKELNIYSVGITNTVSAKRLKKAGAKEVIKKIEELIEIVEPSK